MVYKRVVEGLLSPVCYCRLSPSRVELNNGIMAAPETFLML